MKQPAWQSMPVLDVRTLSSNKLGELAAIYDHFSIQDLKALSQLKTDDARWEIDLAIRAALDLPDFSFIRDLLDREPGMSAVGIAERNTPADEDEEAERLEESGLF
jgi:hypothetical protein